AEADVVLPAPVPVSAEEIAEGLALCAKFPVDLLLDDLPVESEVPPLIVRGRTLIPARALFERMGASVSWNEETRQVFVIATNAAITLTIDAFEYAINGNIYPVDVPPLIVGDRTLIPVRIVAEAMGCEVQWDDPARTVAVASPLPASETPPAFAGDPAPDAISRGDAPARADAAGSLPQLSPEFAGFFVMIDAGHGGIDPGAVGKGDGGPDLFEKDVNLDVALRLEAYLLSAGFSVRMIRSGDDTVDVYERPQIANAQGVQAYISIHNNSSRSPDISGTSTYYYNKEWAAGYPLDSETLAVSVQKSVSAYAGLPDLGVRDGSDYIVLNRTQMPAVIVEGAFLSNASDRALMRTDAYRDAYAFGVAVGLINALNGRATNPLDGMMPVGL
ncbi:MAG: N-acetylmuramoyl-L-alanine amidase, partial [Clostridiales Family XIII bacterium]|nr:N-acetylmuramoyl-L-alanine amidase [Clostridiales Family XIII bacterium]